MTVSYHICHINNNDNRDCFTTTTTTSQIERVLEKSRGYLKEAFNYVKQHYEFTSLDFEKHLIALGASPHTARNYLSLFKRYGMVKVKIRKTGKVIYRSIVYDGGKDA